LLTLMLPPHLLANRAIPQMNIETTTWMILPAAALLLVILLWLVGGVGFSRIQPVVMTYLVLLILFHSTLSPKLVLHNSKLMSGDILDADFVQVDAARRREPAWIYDRHIPRVDAVYVPATASDQLTEYLAGGRTQQRLRRSLETLIRDAMPPLEDLVVGGQPRPIGMGSAIAVLIGGLFLLYRGLIDYRVPALVLGAAYVMFFLLPVPIVIDEAGAQWRPLLFPRGRLDWPTIITFANYQLMASPLIFMAFFLATEPSLRPVHRRARTMYGIALGTAAAAGQLYLSVASGAYVGLMIVGVFVPWMEKWGRGSRASPES